MLTDSAKLMGVWRQTRIPVAWRDYGPKRSLLAKLPFDNGNRNWLSAMGRRRPEWDNDAKHWTLPKSWFNSLVDRSLERFGHVYVIQPYREQEKCSPSCMGAKGHECQCSCMGANHGAGNDGSWFEVSESFATRWREREIACRLMTVKG